MLRNSLLAALPALALAALAPGCGTPSRGLAPSATSARESLDKALSAWQAGGKADPLALAEPRLHVVDHQWLAGQALDGYEILSEEPGAGDAEKRYAVLLRLEKPKAEKRVQYVIIGRDPVWVFRDDDYQRTSDMGDNPRPTRPARRPRRS